MEACQSGCRRHGAEHSSRVDRVEDVAAGSVGGGEVGVRAQVLEEFLGRAVPLAAVALAPVHPVANVRPARAGKTVGRSQTNSRCCCRRGCRAARLGRRNGCRHLVGLQQVGVSGSVAEGGKLGVVDRRGAGRITAEGVPANSEGCKTSGQRALRIAEAKRGPERGVRRV